MTRRKGYGFRDRFGGGDAPKPDPEPEETPVDELLVPVVPYLPIRCPFCRARHPKHNGVGRGRVRLHYLRCQECDREYHAREIDPAE